MNIENSKTEEIRRKIRDSLKDSNMEIEDEPQSSGDPKKIFETDEQRKEEGKNENQQP